MWVGGKEGGGNGGGGGMGEGICAIGPPGIILLDVAIDWSTYICKGNVCTCAFVH